CWFILLPLYRSSAQVNQIMIRFVNAVRSSIRRAPFGKPRSKPREGTMIARKICCCVAGFVLALGVSVAAQATVTWDFFETALSFCNGPCALPPQPYVLASLTLPGPTSMGSASYG